MATKAGKEYELLIEKIYKELEPNAEIKQDDYIWGEETQSKRQIDLSIRSKIAGSEMLIVIQAKDYKNKADMNVIGTFISVIRDVRANKGILISNSGFTKKAIAYAKKEGIELYSAHTAYNKRWDLEIKIPVIKTEYNINFSYGVMIPVTPGEKIHIGNIVELRDENGVDRVDIIDFVINQYKNKNLDFSGKIRKHSFPKPKLKVHPNDQHRMVERIDVEYSLTKKAKYINYYTPNEYRALKDYIKEMVKTSYINYDDLIPFIATKDWQRIKPDTYIPVSPKTHFIDATIFDFNGNSYVRFESKEV